MIIDLTIEDDPNRFVLIRNWLVSARNVDNTQPSHRQSYISIDEIPFIVGPAVHNLLIHPREDISIHLLSRFTIEDAADSTHAQVSSLAGSLRNRRLDCQMRRLALLPISRYPFLSK